MIIRIFKYISKRLNSIIRFISVRILKRKKGMTFIEFIYLVLSEFQKTIFYKALTIIYKIVAVFIAFLSLGIFYDQNYEISNFQQFINKILNIIIEIYNILFNTLKSILKLIFKNIYKDEDEDLIHEPYEYYIDNKYDLGQESTSAWYQDWSIIGLSFLLLILLGYTYKKWDSDSTFRDNILEICSSLFLSIKSIKDTLLNKLNNRRNEETNESNDGNDSIFSWNDSDNNSESSINLKITPENVDLRIISDPYKYTLFKNLHKIEDWPEYGSNDHNVMITKLMNTDSRFIKHTYENLDNLMETYYKNAEILKTISNEEFNELENKDSIINLNNQILKTNEEVKTLMLAKDYAKENNEWIKQRSFDLSNKNNDGESIHEGSPSGSTYETPKASTSKLPEESFLPNIKGKFKQMFKSDSEENLILPNKTKLIDSVSNILTRTTSLLNEDESTLENLTEIKNDVNNNKQIEDSKSPLPDAKTYKLDLLNPQDKVYHIHAQRPNELCDCVPVGASEAQQEILKDYKKSALFSSIKKSITGESISNPVNLKTISEEQINQWSKKNVNQEALENATRGKVTGNPEIRYINPENFVSLSDIDKMTSSS